MSDYALAWSTPLIAAVAALITLRQWATARQAHRLSMFDRRWSVYKGTKHFVAEPVIRGSISDEMLRSFLVATEGAEWLFDKAMGRFLRKDLYENGLKLQQLTTLTAGKVYATDDERQQERDEVARLKSWFNDQLNGLDDRFRPFMHVKH
ncbi:hypothetical protein [Roseateles sp.]|uniref:hypothetical protein n=1 Tax=Roseateles sp. TaxID=1971397 RepID=UPI002F3F426B